MMHKRITLFFLVVVMLGTTGCSKIKKDHTPLALVSIPPYALMVEQIAGDTIDIVSITKESTDPHTYEPSAKEASNYQRASIWFGIGEEFEIKLGKSSKRLRDVYQDLMQSIPKDRLIPSCSSCSHHHHHDSYDNHVWLNFDLIIDQLKFIKDKLSQLLPEHKNLYHQNFSLIKAKLARNALQQRRALKKPTKPIIVTVHNCLGYFLQQTTLQQVSIEAEGEKETHINQLGAIHSYFEEDKVLLIITQPQHLDKAAIMLAEKFNIPRFSFNPYTKNYIENINQLTAAIASNEQ